MIGIFDNGALMLGKVRDIIKHWDKECRSEDIDCNEDILKELKELLEVDDQMIVCINYEHPMGYSLDYWSSNDRIKYER